MQIYLHIVILFVIAGKCANLIAEFDRFIPFLDFYLACESLNFVNALRPSIFRYLQQLDVKGHLIIILQEGDEEF